MFMSDFLLADMRKALLMIYFVWISMNVYNLGMSHALSPKTVRTLLVLDVLMLPIQLFFL